MKTHTLHTIIANALTEKDMLDFESKSLGERLSIPTNSLINHKAGRIISATPKRDKKGFKKTGMVYKVVIDKEPLLSSILWHRNSHYMLC